MKLGNMRGSSMHYEIKKTLGTTALALVLCAAAAFESRAQGVVTLEEETIPLTNGQQSKSTLDDPSIPDEISLFEEEGEAVPAAAPAAGLVTPPSSGTLPFGAEEAANTNVVPSPVPPAAAPAPQPQGLELNLPQDLPETEEEKAPVLAAKEPDNGILGTGTAVIDDNLFSQMSDIEKQTALLSLELRREKVKNEIEAIKNQRQKAIDEEKAKAEEKERKKIEWEKEQEQKVIQEKQKLRELDIQYEKARQEKLLKAYKNQMLEETQKWVKNNGDLYLQMNQLKNEKKELVADISAKFDEIAQLAATANQDAAAAKEAFAQQVNDLQTQISILKARIEAQEREMQAKQNPFAEGEEAVEETKVEAEPVVVEEVIKLSDLYAVMEIRGKGGELIAKLINKDGTPFMVKVGTALQTGHIVDEITSTYIRADKGGIKDYLYFAAGGILDKEPLKTDITLKDSVENATAIKEDNDPDSPANRFLKTSATIPGMGNDMIIR